MKTIVRGARHTLEPSALAILNYLLKLEPFTQNKQDFTKTCEKHLFTPDPVIFLLTWKNV